jgi:hypothetical protein
VGYIPLERLLIETDAPYLTPVPQKNKTRRNEPAFVKSVLLKLAEIRDLDPENLAQITYSNASCLFNITNTSVTGALSITALEIKSNSLGRCRSVPTTRFIC